MDNCANLVKFETLFNPCITMADYTLFFHFGILELMKRSELRHERASERIERAALMTSTSCDNSDCIGVPSEI